MKTTLTLILLLIGCMENSPHIEPPVQIQNYEIRQIIKSVRTVKESNSSGSYFIVAASYSSSGTERVETRVNMFINGGNGFQFVSIDLENIRIKIDNTLTKPHLSIKTKFSWLPELSELIRIHRVRPEMFTITIHCPEKFLPERLLPLGL
jgi:hypothetical protein